MKSTLEAWLHAVGTLSAQGSKGLHTAAPDLHPPVALHQPITSPHTLTYTEERIKCTMGGMGTACMQFRHCSTCSSCTQMHAHMCAQHLPALGCPPPAPCAELAPVCSVCMCVHSTCQHLSALHLLPVQCLHLCAVSVPVCIAPASTRLPFTCSLWNACICEQRQRMCAQHLPALGYPALVPCALLASVWSPSTCFPSVLLISTFAFVPRCFTCKYAHKVQGKSGW